MAPRTPHGPPTRLRSGTTWIWSIAVPGDYTEAEWTFKYQFRGEGLNREETLAPGTGDDAGRLVINVTAANTKGILPGRVLMQLKAHHDNTGGALLANRVDEIGRVITLQLLPDVEHAGAGDLGTTHAERMTRLIKARLETRLVAGKQIESYGVEGLAVSKIPWKELRRQLAFYAAQWREQTTKRFGRPVRMRF